MHVIHAFRRGRWVLTDSHAHSVSGDVEPVDQGGAGSVGYYHLRRSLYPVVVQAPRVWDRLKPLNEVVLAGSKYGEELREVVVQIVINLVL